MCYHIQSSHENGVSWCGEKLSLANGFYFRDVEAAVLNGLHDKKQITCAICTDILIAYLQTGKFIDRSINKDIIAGKFENTSNADNS